MPSNTSQENEINLVDEISKIKQEYAHSIKEYYFRMEALRSKYPKLFTKALTEAETKALEDKKIRNDETKPAT